MLRGLGNILNQANLALSMFHGLNTTTDVMASHIGLGLRKMVTPKQRVAGVGTLVSGLLPTTPVVNLWRGNNLMKAYRQDLDKIDDPKLRVMVEKIISAGGRARLDPFYHNRAIQSLVQSISDVARGSARQKMVGLAKLPYNIPTSVLEGLAKPILEWLVPRQKLGLFSVMAQHEMKRAETQNLSDEVLLQNLIRVWDSVDNRMGQLVYDNLFWNKVLKDSLMLSIRSVGWNLGSWREYGGTPIDILTTKGRVGHGDVWLSHKMGYAMGAVILYSILGAVITYILTGESPEEPKDYFFTKTGAKNPDGSDERISLPTYAKDWFAYADHPSETVKNKLHPIWAVLADTWQNENYYGVEIRHKDDPIIQQALDLAEFAGKSFLPFSVRNYQKMRRAGHAVWKSGLTSVTGITSAPAYIARTPAHKLMMQYIVDRIPQGARTTEQYEQSQRRKTAKQKLREGVTVTSEERKAFTRTQWKRITTEAKRPPFADSYRRLTFGEALNVYVIASDKERKQVRDILQDKQQRARRDRPGFAQEDTLYKEIMAEEGITDKSYLARRKRRRYVKY